MERLKKVNRTVWELWIGILLFGLFCQAAGMFLVSDRMLYSRALWAGILAALFMVLHMYRGLDAALEAGPEAWKLLAFSNLLRYGGIVGLFALVLFTGSLNPLFVFQGVMSLKVAAYLYPVIHRICNRILKEVEKKKGKEEGRECW